VPVDHVIAIYARENGQGMAFPVPTEPAAASTDPAPVPDRPTQPGGLRLATGDAPPATEAPAGKPTDDGEPPEPPTGGRPALKRIK
jgi:stringent starvation protein B